MLERLLGLTGFAFAALAPASSALAPASSASLQEEVSISDADLTAFGKELAIYFEEREMGVALDDARSAVTARVESIRNSTEGGDLLRQTADIRRALRLARDDPKHSLQAGKVNSETHHGGSFQESGLEIGYRLPEDYDPRAASYALILAIPDAGERAEDHIRSHWMARDVRRAAIVLTPTMPEEAQGWDQVVHAGRPGGLAHVLTALRWAEQRFAVDPDRIYVAGRGPGVAAALATGDYSPQRFAGIIGRAGDASDLAPDNFGNLPTLFLDAGAAAEAFHAKSQALGNDNCRVEAEDLEQGVWRWILEHPRQPYPIEVTVQTGQPFPTRAYWLRVAPSAPEARASGKIDRARNTIEITSRGVSHVTLYLNDQLVDLNRPVRVSIDGVEQSADVKRSLRDFLDLLADGTSDEASLYVARVSFEASASGIAAAAIEASGPSPAFEERWERAGTRTEELWELYTWCRSNEQLDAGEWVLRRILRVDPEHAPARQAAGFFGGDGQWFRAAAAYERFQRGQAEAHAESKGHIRLNSTWLHRDQRSFANKGWVKNFGTGEWFSKADQKRLSEGWVRQDESWISPDEAQRVDAGQWWVDGEWCDLRTANRRHASLDNPWILPAGDVRLHTTVERDTAWVAAEHMGRAIQDLQRVFGLEPALPLDVALLRDEEQYDSLAIGDPDGRRGPTHSGGLNTLHSAFFGERWFRRVDRKLEYSGMGIGYWDSQAPNGDLYGVHAARLAAGFSYVDAVDPSPGAVKRASSKGFGGYSTAFEEEKELPAWLRFGSAVYGERYFRDDQVAAGNDPWWARHWSLENLKQRGGLRELEEVLRFDVDPGDRADGLKLMLEAGLIVAFIVDGECAPVKEAHADFKRSMLSGRAIGKQVKALTAAVLAQRSDLETFAGL